MTDPSTSEPPARSFLYVPGDRPDMLAKAGSRGADALIVDLEDAVAPKSKAIARETVGRWLAEVQPPLPQLWVRINAASLVRDDDLAAVVGPMLSGIYVPKVDSLGEIAEVAARLASLEAAADLEPGRILIAPLLESAAGILAATDIAHGPRVSHLSIGEEDLAADLGMHPSHDRRELAPMRTQVVLASAAAGINPPIGPVEIEFRDLDSLRVSSQALRRMGYGGRTAIHPAQISVINEAFTPTAEEVATARDIVEQFELMQQEGSGVGVRDGTMIDLAIVRRARRTLAAARER